MTCSTYGYTSIIICVVLVICSRTMNAADVDEKQHALFTELLIQRAEHTWKRANPTYASSLQPKPLTEDQAALHAELKRVKARAKKRADGLANIQKAWSCSNTICRTINCDKHEIDKWYEVGTFYEICALGIGVE